MTRVSRSRGWTALTEPGRRVLDLIRRWRRRPPEADVREPRRPKPTLPAAAIALEEPRTAVYRWVRLLGWRRDTGSGA